jgi:hypothetical protein
MPPAERGVGVSGADRVAMAALAVDMKPRMLGDGIVPGQKDRSTRREAGKDRRDVAACQGRKRPVVTREDAVIAAGMAGCEASQKAKQVGDGASAQGEDRGQSQEDESTMGRPRERRLEGVEDGADRFGKLLVNVLDPPPGGSGLASVLTLDGPKPFADLLI